MIRSSSCTRKNDSAFCPIVHLSVEIFSCPGSRGVCMSDQDESDKRLEGNSRFDFGRFKRRTFLSRLGTASLLATGALLLQCWGNGP